MKLITLLLLNAWSLASFAQCNYQINKVDEFTGKMERWLAPETVCKGIKIGLAKVDSVYLLGAYADLGCVTSESNLYIKFEDGTVLKLGHQFKADCDSYQVAFYSNITDDLDELKSKRIAKVRITGTQHTLEGEFKKPDMITTQLKECLNN